MTHCKEDVQKIAELNSTFMTLNDKGKDSALTILRALSFAQAVMGADAPAIRGGTDEYGGDERAVF